MTSLENQIPDPKELIGFTFPMEHEGITQRATVKELPPDKSQATVELMDGSQNLIDYHLLIKKFNSPEEDGNQIFTHLVALMVTSASRVSGRFLSNGVVQVMNQHGNHFQQCAKPIQSPWQCMQSSTNLPTRRVGSGPRKLRLMAPSSFDKLGEFIRLKSSSQLSSINLESKCLKLELKPWF